MSKFNFNNKVNFNNSSIGDNNTINNFINENSDVHFDDVDKQLIRLIHENVESVEERKRLLESLKTTNTSEVSEEKKSTSREILISFLKSGFSETGKILASMIMLNKFGLHLPE